MHLNTSERQTSEAPSPLPSNPLLNLWLPLLIPACHPYKSKPADPLPHSCSPLCSSAFLRNSLCLGTKDSIQEGTVLTEAGRRGSVGESCVVRLFGVNNKAHFCVGELEISHEQCSELFTDQPVLINSASGALTWQWVGMGGGCAVFVSRSVWACLLFSGWSAVCERLRIIES